MLPVRVPLQVDGLDGAYGVVELVLGARARNHEFIILLYFGDGGWPASQVFVGLRAD